MPICKKCNKGFPNIVKIKGKQQHLHRRSYCLECSPFGLKNGYNLRRKATDATYVTKFNSVDKLTCPICDREFPRRRKNNSVCSTCRTMYVRTINRKKAIDFLGGKCYDCDESDYDVLQFHHTDPNVKEFTMSSSWGNKKWENLLDEVKKCILLCANCHTKKHRKNIQKILDYFKAI